MRLPSTIPDEGVGKTQPLPEGTKTKDKDSYGFKPPADMESSSHPITTLLRTDAKYQVDKTHSTRFEVSVPDQHQSKTSYEVELDSYPLVLLTVAAVQALLLYDDELVEENAMISLRLVMKWIKTSKKLMKKKLKQPESSKAKDTNTSDSKSSSCSESFKPYDNYMLITEWQLSEIKGFHDVAYKVHRGTEAAFSHYEKLLVQFNKQTGKNVNQILSSLKEIRDVIKEDPALNKKVRYQVNKDASKSQVEVTDVGDIEAPNQTKPVSFVNIVNCEKPKKKIIFRSLVNDQRVEDTDFELPLTAIEGVKHMSANTLVGYFVEDKLSLITTQIGKPLMLNAFTSSMCADSCGHISFARALIEVSAEKELKQEVVMASLIVDGTGFTKERIRVEYEWIPPLCLDFHIFGNAHEQCPKRITEPMQTNTDDQADGFTTITNRKKNGKRKNQARHVEG
nr:hypothetical protein [Tanacetum cinerariifolium]